MDRFPTASDWPAGGGVALSCFTRRAFCAKDDNGQLNTGNRPGKGRRTGRKGKPPVRQNEEVNADDRSGPRGAVQQ